MLDGLVVAIVALVAGGSPDRGLVLGASMVLLQAAIGTLNDVVDAPADAGRKPGKPIPAGVVAPSVARVIAAVCGLGGMILATIVSPVLGALAVLVLAIGAAYDLRAKGTAFSWAPFAAGIPLLPVFGWYGASGSLPAVFLVLVPSAALAGATLAVANAVVDLERDAAAGSRSVAIALGAERSAAVVLGLQVAIGGLALATALIGAVPTGWVLLVVLASAVPIGGAWLGRVAVRPGRVRFRELAWEIQAVGIGLLAVTWLLGLAAGGS